jgi:hypothetical protein
MEFYGTLDFNLSICSGSDAFCFDGESVVNGGDSTFVRLLSHRDLLVVIKIKLLELVSDKRDNIELISTGLLGSRQLNVEC